MTFCGYQGEPPTMQEVFLEIMQTPEMQRALAEFGEKYAKIEARKEALNAFDRWYFYYDDSPSSLAQELTGDDQWLYLHTNGSVILKYFDIRFAEAEQARLFEEELRESPFVDIYWPPWTPVEHILGRLQIALDQALKSGVNSVQGLDRTKRLAASIRQTRERFHVDLHE